MVSKGDPALQVSLFGGHPTLFGVHWLCSFKYHWNRVIFRMQVYRIPLSEFLLSSPVHPRGASL